MGCAHLVLALSAGSRTERHVVVLIDKHSPTC